MSLLGFLLRSSRGLVILSVVTAAVSGLGGVALIALVHHELGREAPSSAVLGIAFAGLCLLTASTRVVAQVAMARMGQGAVTEMAIRLCRDLLKLPLARFEAIDSSRLLAVLTEDIVIVAGALVGIPQVAINIPLVVICLAYTGWLSPVILACGAGFATLAVLAYLTLISPAMNHLQGARAAQDALVGHFRTLIDGFRELKLHAPRRAAFLSRALAPSAARVRDRSIAGQTFFALAEGWGELAFFGFLGFLLFILPTFQNVTRPTLVGAVLVVLYVMAPLDVILTWVPILGRARASIARIESLLPTLDATESETPADFEPIVFRDSLCLADVTHAYRSQADDAGFHLGPIDLTLRPGEIVILAGGNGSGKTTLVKILAGLYAPLDGSIRVDGRAIGDRERAAYRGLFSVVFADGHLFPDLSGLERDGLDGEAEAGLQRLGLGDRVRLRDGAYSTLELSQGQRRRLALLSACLEKRPICIFDEWAANQDPKSRRAFYHEILPELKAEGKALLVISHDEDEFEVADRVIRLRDGRIVEEFAADRVPFAVGESVP